MSSPAPRPWRHAADTRTMPASLRWRRLQPADLESLRAFYAAQSAEDRRLRFHAAVSRVGPCWLDSMLSGGNGHHVAFAATAARAGIECLVAECMLAFDFQADGTSVEIGMIVDAAWRGQGVGAWCLNQIEHEARARRAACLRADLQAGNEAMLALLRQHGFEETSTGQEAASRRFERRLVPARLSSCSSGWRRFVGMGLAHRGASG